MLDFIIEPTQKADLNQIVEIEKEAYGNHCWSRDSFSSELENNLARYYCAKIDSQIAGYIGSWFIFEEAHITTFAVAKKYRNKHIATNLMLRLIEQCYEEKIKFITLEVRESNEPAIKLYEKFALKTVNVRKKYYQDNDENALIMFSENIFYDKFKKNFQQLKKCLKSKARQNEH